MQWWSKGHGSTLGGPKFFEMSFPYLKTFFTQIRRFVFRQQFNTETTRKFSNFNFQWIKSLFQDDLNNIAFFFFYIFSRVINVISYL